MLSLLILFLVLSSFAIFCISKSSVPQHGFEEYLPVTCSGIVLILFAFGLMGMLKLGVYVILGLSALFYGISILTIVRNKSYISFCRNFFSPGFILFCLLYAGLFVLNYGRVASSWDEFSHWADVVKAMYLIDDFSTSKLAYSSFQSYVPGMALFQYFFQKVHQIIDAYSGFSEWRLYLSYQLFFWSFFFPFLKHLSYKKILVQAFLFVFVLLSPTVFFQYYFPTGLYIDAFVGILAGSGFAMLYICRKKDLFIYISFMLILAMLVLSKDVGMMFAIFMAIAMIADEFICMYQHGSKPTKKSLYRFCFVFVGVVAALALTKGAWNYNIQINGAEKRFSAPIKLDILFDVLSGTDHSYRAVVKENYIHSLFNDKELIGCFSLTWPAIFLILVILLCSVHLLYQIKAAESHGSRRMIIFVIIIQTLLYIAGLGVLYLFRFSEYEAVRLASFSRYLGIAALAILITIMLLVYSYLTEHPARMSDLGVITLSMILLVLPIENIRPFLNRSSVKHSISHRAGFQSAITHMLDIAQGEPQRVYVVSQESNGFDELVLRYCLRPCITTGASLSPDGPLYEEDIWTEQKTVEEWKKELQDFDYVITFDINDLFLKNYGSVFENTEDAVNQAIFSVNHETGLLVRCW